MPGTSEYHVMGLEEHGYQIIPRALESGEIEALRREVVRLQWENARASLRRVCEQSSRIAALAVTARQWLPEPLRLVRSLLFDKVPGENWPVAWHQDLTICVREREDVPGYGPWSDKHGVPHVQPPEALLHRMIAVRFHLDDVPASNGALRVRAGSHRFGKRADADGPPEGCPEHTIACRKGDLLLMRPLLWHASSRATEATHRRVLHFEYALAEALDPALAWFEGDHPQS